MKVPAEIKKCVAFIGVQPEGLDFKPKGTALFVAGRAGSPLYIATAKHVIEGLKNKGADRVAIRLNLKNGLAGLMSVSITDWKYHPDETVDIAVRNFAFERDYDHKALPLSLAMTEVVVGNNEIDVGDEVFITGMFKHHHGKNKNIPIVRVGNIAAMREEKVQTKDYLMDAYLIEARSIGGLSGSPVFVNIGHQRVINGGLKTQVGGPTFFLMGLIHGHYDTDTNKIDESIEDKVEHAQVNSGIAIVTPVEKLLSMII